jgi:hypothetical protein
MLKQLISVLRKPALLIFLFFILYFLKRWVSPNTVIFYEGVSVSIVTFLIGISLSLYFYKKLDFEKFKQWISAAFIQVFFCYSFVITFPALLDRSISLFIIASVAKIDRPVEREKLVAHFKDGYVDKSFTVDKRLDEQIISGNMKYENEKIEITKRGKRLYAFNIFLAKIFNISQKYVDPDVIYLNRKN